MPLFSLLFFVHGGLCIVVDCTTLHHGGESAIAGHVGDDRRKNENACDAWQGRVKLKPTRSSTGETLLLRDDILDGYCDEPDREYDPDVPEQPSRPRDAATDRAKQELALFFENRPHEVFYERQIEVVFEGTYFHWITSRALSELVADKAIASDLLPLKGVGFIRFYRAKAHRYWHRQATEIIALVQQFSASSFTRGLGHQGETMFDAALPTVGFLPTGRDVRAFGDRIWTETEHNLDRIYERDGVAYGTEIKNTLPYIETEELEVKLRMCAYLRVRPLFIVRAAPKSYIEYARKRGGFTLVFKFQLYPFGQELLAKRVRERLLIPVDVPARIAHGTVQRFLNWHLRHLPST